MRLIETEADLAEGSAWLSQVCPVWARVLPVLGPLPLRRRADGFAAIRDAIIGQQISTAAAAAISARINDAGLTDEASVARLSEDDLRALGLSRPKARYLAAIAGAGVDWGALRDMSDD